MKEYLDLLEKVYTNGRRRSDRTGTGTVSLFGDALDIDLQKGFPLLTTKLIHFPSVFHELMWFLSGDTNIKYLKDNGVSIWNEWADTDGNLGPIYGKQWVNWKVGSNRSINQIAELINGIRHKPYSRRHVVSAWNTAVLPDESISPQYNVALNRMSLAPCHVMFQVYVRDLSLSEKKELYENNLEYGNLSPDIEENILDWHMHIDKLPTKALDMQMHMRSIDMFLGLPYNIASYALLTHMLCKTLSMIPGRLRITLGDYHIYSNHYEQVEEQLSRQPRDLPSIIMSKDPFPNHVLTNPETITENGFTVGVFNYDPYPPIKAEISI